jgi:ribose/xylose/arabinose/galactoside ABC-type transport system permease subunit
VSAPAGSNIASPSARPSLLRRLFGAQEAGLCVVILLVMLGLTIYGQVNPKTMPVRDADGKVQRDENGRPVTQEVNRFLELTNIVQNTTTASFIAVMAVGMTLVIILAGVDLSVGSIYALAALLGAMALKQLDPESSVWLSVPLAVIICCAVGLVLGAVNGAMIVGLKVHPFIITLGTMTIYRGLVVVFSGAQTVSGLPESVQRGFFKYEAGGVYPTLTIIMIVVALIGALVLSRTVFGRRVYAIGGNETAAKYAGVPVGRVKIWCYALVGMLAGLSACMYIGYFGAAENAAGSGYELKVIAATVIGGASLSGGRGSAVGAVLGAILVQLIDNAMIILGIDQNYNQIVMGAAIVAAVVIDQAKGGAGKR